MASVLVRSACSGEVLAEFGGDDFRGMLHGNTVKALKLELMHQGFGGRFQLRLLNDTREVPDEEILDPPLDLRLVRIPFDGGDTQALLKASKEGRLAEVETRLKKLQDPNVADMSGKTALYLAAWNGHLDCARLLVEAGSSLKQTQRCYAPLYAAEWRGHLEVARLLEMQERGARWSDQVFREG